MLACREVRSVNILNLNFGSLSACSFKYAGLFPLPSLNFFKEVSVNIFIWILQILLAVHTAIGAVWKFSNSEQSVTSLQALPHTLWLGLSGIELLCCVGLLLPLFSKKFSLAAPVAAICIAAEMLLFCMVSFLSGAAQTGELVYWLVVTAVCAFIAYNRFTKRIA